MNKTKNRRRPSVRSATAKNKSESGGKVHLSHHHIAARSSRREHSFLIRRLFNPNDPANHIYPPQRILDEILALINDEALKDIWAEDETIG